MASSPQPLRCRWPSGARVRSARQPPCAMACGIRAGRAKRLRKSITSASGIAPPSSLIIAATSEKARASPRTRRMARLRTALAGSCMEEVLVWTAYRPEARVHRMG